MEPLVIDFADREDIRAKLPAARERLEELQALLKAQEEEVEDWKEYVAVLTRRAELPPSTEAARAVPQTEAETEPELPRDVQPLDLVVEVVNRQMRKIRPKEVREILRAEGHDLASDAVSNALFYAAKRAKPPRVKQALGRGYYAPLDFVEKTPDWDLAASQLRTMVESLNEDREEARGDP